MKKNGVNVWMISTFVLFGILLFVAGTFFPNLFLKKNETVLPQKISITPNISPIITATISSTLNPSPTVYGDSDLMQIQKAFAKKYNKTISEAEVTISSKDDTHISGGIKFVGDVSGGWFLAYKGVDGWIIVQDGNGTISCETIAPYNFPKTMVSECVDKNGKLVK